MHTDASESKSGGEPELGDVIVVRGREVGIFEVFF